MAGEVAEISSAGSMPGFTFDAKMKWNQPDIFADLDREKRILELSQRISDLEGVVSGLQRSIADMNDKLNDVLVYLKEAVATSQENISTPKTIVKEKMDTDLQNTSSEIDSIEKLYTFRNRDIVRDSLSGKKTLVTMISAIHENIRKEFPLETIFLDAISDSPLSDEKDIVISVSTSLPVDEAIERLDKVEDVKWSKSSKDRVDICVKLEYQ